MAGLIAQTGAASLAEARGTVSAEPTSVMAAAGKISSLARVHSAEQRVAEAANLRRTVIIALSFAGLWVLCMATVWGTSVLAAGRWPAASLTLGWPLGLASGLAIWLYGGGFWRVLIVVGWCVVFPIATPHYFELSGRVGLFLGRVPNFEPLTLAHCLMFLLIPTALTTALIGWGGRWQRAATTALCLAAATLTTLQVCWCGQHLIDNPLFQVWVWNGAMLGGLCIACGVRLCQLLGHGQE